MDVRTVTGTTRVIRNRINIALLVRDRHCVVPTCGKRLGQVTPEHGEAPGVDGPVIHHQEQRRRRPRVGEHQHLDGPLLMDPEVDPHRVP